MSPAMALPLQRSPLALRLAMVYFVLIFAIMPLDIIGSESESAASRIPLVFGFAMLVFALPELRADLGLPRGFVPLFICFMSTYLLSGMYGNAGVVEALRLFFAQVGIGLVILLAARHFSSLRVFLSAVIWVAGMNAAYGILFLIPGLSDLGYALVGLGMPVGVMRADETRLVGFLSDPTYCGLVLATGFFNCLERYVSSGGTKRTVYSVLAIVFGLGVFLTASRTSWVAMAAGLLVWRSTSWSARGRLLLVVTSIVFVGYYSLEYLQEFLYTVLGRVDIARSDSRTWIWGAYYDIAVQWPWGYGVGSIETVRKYATALYLPGSTARPHNYFLILWVENGVQTLIPFLLMIVIAWRRVRPTIGFADIRTGEQPGRLAVTMLVSLSVGLFGIGGMSQLLYLSLAMCLLSETYVRNGELVPAKSKKSG
jgi:hypothetical protein